MKVYGFITDIIPISMGFIVNKLINVRVDIDQISMLKIKYENKSMLDN